MNPLPNGQERHITAKINETIRELMQIKYRLIMNERLACDLKRREKCKAKVAKIDKMIEDMEYAL